MPHWLRVLGTGSFFVLFGVGGLVLTFVVFPLLRLRGGTAEERRLRCQRVVHHTFRHYMALMCAARISTLRIEGTDKLASGGPWVVISNHPTLLDVVVLLTLFPEMDVVVKRATLSNPFMLGVIHATGYLSNDEGPAVVEACAERLRSGRSVLVFPEGTRSPVGGLRPFQRGAAHMALEAGRPLLPITLRCQPPSLGRGQKWYDVPDAPLGYSVAVGDPVSPAEAVPPGTPRGAAARRVTAALRDFYVKNLHTRDPRGNDDAVA